MKKSNIALAVFFTAMFVLAYLVNVNTTPQPYHFNDMDSLINIGVAKPLGTPDEHGVYRQGVLINRSFYRPSDADGTYEKAQTCRYQ